MVWAYIYNIESLDPNYGMNHLENTVFLYTYLVHTVTKEDFSSGIFLQNCRIILLFGMPSRHIFIT
jgi:hypothetical protein